MADVRRSATLLDPPSALLLRRRSGFLGSRELPPGVIIGVLTVYFSARTIEATVETAQKTQRAQVRADFVLEATRIVMEQKTCADAMRRANQLRILFAGRLPRDFPDQRLGFRNFVEGHAEEDFPGHQGLPTRAELRQMALDYERGIVENWCLKYDIP